MNNNTGKEVGILVVRVTAYLILFAGAIASLLPLYWMITGSFKETASQMQMPPEWFPVHPTFENYKTLFRRAPVVRWFINSAVIASVLTGTNLLFNSLAGYAFAKKDFPGKNAIFWMIISTMMVPGQVTLVPLFIMMTKLHLVNTFTGIMLPGVAGAFGLFLMKQFMQTLPSELIDAARIDGCSEWSTFYRVMLPLAKPALAVLGIFVFIGQWNNFVWPLIMTNSKEMRTLQVGLATLRQEHLTDWGLLMSGATLAALPMIIIFFAFQRYFMTGLTIGATKG